MDLPDDSLLLPDAVERIGEAVLDGAFAIHREVGPGLREKVYARGLESYLRGRGFRVEREVELPVYVLGARVDAGYRVDLWVDRQVIVEVKRVETVLDAHRAQLLTYLWFSGSPLGYVLNFHERWLRSGIHRAVETRPRPFPTPSRS